MRIGAPYHARRRPGECQGVSKGLKVGEARVQAVDSATRLVRTSSRGAQGESSFSSLQPGACDVSVEVRVPPDHSHGPGGSGHDDGRHGDSDRGSERHRDGGRSLRTDSGPTRAAPSATTRTAARTTSSCMKLAARALTATRQRARPWPRRRHAPAPPSSARLA